MLLKVLLIMCIGALQIAGDFFHGSTFGRFQMIECGGTCNEDQYLVCAGSRRGGYYKTFPNHCFLKVFKECAHAISNNSIETTFEEARPGFCSFHKGYMGIFKYTCEEFELMGIKQKEILIKKINVIINASDPLIDTAQVLKFFKISPNFNDEIEALQQQLNEILMFTECPMCTEASRYKYRECSETEEGKFKQAISDYYKEYKQYLDKYVPDIMPDQYVNMLINLMENMLNKVTSVRGIKEYYNKKIERLYNVYVETKRKIENYIITNDISSVGKTIKDSYKMAVGKLNPNPRCPIVSELNRLSEEIVEIITPNTSKYSEPSLDAFIKMYGGLTENKGVLELIRSYERVLKTAEQDLLNLNKINGSSLAFGRLRNVLSSVDNLLGNTSTCLGSGLTDEDGEIYDLLLCLSESNCNSTNIATLRSSLSQCYNVYSMKEYCRSGVSKLSDVKRYNELALCIGLALKSQNKEDINCCFK